MGIKIRPGTGKAAEHELWSFCAAYPVNQVGVKDGLLLFWLPAGREDEAGMFQDMELNAFCGTFDIIKYFMEG